MSEYEAALEKIGAFGPFQIRVFVLVNLFETPLAWAMLLPVFTSATPKLFCLTTMHNHSSLYADKESIEGGNRTFMTEADICQQNKSTCHQVAFDSEFTSIVSEWGLICQEKYIGDLITTIQMTGVLIGAMITGQLADLFGRKKVLFAEYALLLVFWFSTSFAPTWQVYAALRFVVGGLVGGCLVVNFVLPLEYVTPEWRTFCGCIGCWALGLALLAPWAYLLRDWKILNITTSASGVLLLISWWFVDESPRWLLSRGRVKEAEQIIIKAAKFNKRPVPDLTGLQSFVKRERIEKEQEKKYSYWHLCSSWRLAYGTGICMFAWFVSCAVYYGHNFNSKNLAGSRYLNVFLSGLVEIPALLFVLYSNNHWGRRKTVFGLMIASGLACLAILMIDIFSDLEEMYVLTTVMAMLGKCCIAGGWAAVMIFSAETFPTVIRNIGIGACSTAARIGGIVAPQFVFLGAYSRSLPFVIFGSLALMCGLLILLLKETTGQPLPDSLYVSGREVLSSEQTMGLIQVNGDGHAAMNGHPGSGQDVLASEHLSSI